MFSLSFPPATSEVLFLTVEMLIMQLTEGNYFCRSIFNHFFDSQRETRLKCLGAPMYKLAVNTNAGLLGTLQKI